VEGIHFNYGDMAMKMKRLLILLGAAVGFLMISGASFAHHSLSWADNEHPITVSGTVTEFVFANPHSQVWFDNKDKDGNLVHWMIEIGGPPGLHRAGWTSESIKPGDSLTVTGGQAKDGRFIINITGKLMINGKELSTRAGGGTDPN
jgi:hypothetical protein